MFLSSQFHVNFTLLGRSAKAFLSPKYAPFPGLHEMVPVSPTIHPLMAGGGYGLSRLGFGKEKHCCFCTSNNSEEGKVRVGPETKGLVCPRRCPARHIKNGPPD